MRSLLPSARTMRASATTGVAGREAGDAEEDGDDGGVPAEDADTDHDAGEGEIAHVLKTVGRVHEKQPDGEGERDRPDEDAVTSVRIAGATGAKAADELGHPATTAHAMTTTKNSSVVRRVGCR
jgi:hypothetical protein